MFIFALTYRDNNRIHLILVAKGIVVASQICHVCVLITSNFTGGGALAAANRLRFDVTDLQTLRRLGCKW